MEMSKATHTLQPGYSFLDALAVTIVAISVVATVCLSSIASAGTWKEHTERLAQLSKQIETNENEIHELIEKKRATESADQVAQIIRDLETRHLELKKVSTEYEEILQHVRFQHPERSDTIERQYAHYKLKSVTEMEAEFGIDGRLDRVKAHVLSTFPLKEEKLDNREPASNLPKPSMTRSETNLSSHHGKEDDELFPVIHLVK